MSEENERIAAHENRYSAAARAMQSGVAMMMNYEPDHASGKGLKVAANSAQVTVAAMVTLLIDKGLISREEYYEAVADQMETEVKSYEQMIAEHVGAGATKITLA